MLGVCCALFDPALEHFLLRGGELAMRIGRRHHLRFVVARDAPPGFALFGMAGDDCRHAVAIRVSRFGQVEPQVGLAGLFVEAVALEAVFARESDGCRD